MPLIAIATGCVTLVGMFYGAGAMDDVKFIIKYALSRAIVYGFVFSALVLIFAPVLMKIFKPNAEIMGYAVSYLRINALAFPIAPIGLISARVLQGLGKGLPFLVVTLLRVLGIGAPLAYFFVFIQHRPIEWVWISMVLSMIGGAAVGATWLVTTLKGKSEQIFPSAPGGEQPAVTGAA
jgi:Na+-driven multidrug efflux pump